MKDKTDNKGEVVKMRISKEAKVALQKESDKGYRSFQDQVRLVLDEWAAQHSNPTIPHGIMSIKLPSDCGYCKNEDSCFERNIKRGTGECLAAGPCLKQETPVTSGDTQ